VPHFLIHGIDTLLGSSCAARLLQSPDASICCLVSGVSIKQIADLVLRVWPEATAGAIAAPSHQEITSRLCVVDPCLDVHAIGKIAAVGASKAWFFAPAESNETQAYNLGALLSALPAIGVKEFNYVGFDHCGESKPEESDKWTRVSHQEMFQLCQSQNIHCRCFYTCLVVGNEFPGPKQGWSVFFRFVGMLHSFKAEIEEHSPQYFDFHALRCLAPADATLNLLPAGLTSELLLQIADNNVDNNVNDNSSVSIVNPQFMSFSNLCECISMSCGLGLLPSASFNELNAIDRAFHERISAFYEHLAQPELLRKPPLITRLLPDNCLNEETLPELLGSMYRDHGELRSARNQRIADLVGTLREKTVDRNGSNLTYYAAGNKGSAVILLNALGQKLEFWYRLIDELSQSYRVFIWEPRGTSPSSSPLGLADQVDDLDAVLQNENIETCHLVGWCTGPKIAIDFYLRRPGMVQSMAFLNSTFKCDGSPKELDTPYERNLEFLCRRLMLKPSMAASIMNTFQSRTEESETDILSETAAEQMSVKVLSTLNTNLKIKVLAPFMSEETTRNYAHQLVEFWSNDVRPKAADVHAPVLLMSAEYDAIASPASSQMAVGMFPNARHVHVQAATHYCLYDRPDIVADLLRSFFENPGDMPVAPAKHVVAMEA
jgi:pimeloyl-ACP methyl ester carboxylesterase